MAQVGQTYVVPMAVGSIGISTNNSDWTDISGYGFAVEPSGGERAAGEMYTHDGDTALIAAGKRQPQKIKFSGVYTEDSTSPFGTVWGQYITANGGALYVRYTPKAGVTGDWRYTSDLCVITACTPPATDPESAKPTPFAFEVVTAKVTKAAIS